MTTHANDLRPGNYINVSRDVRNHALVGFGLQVDPADPDKITYSRNEAWQDLLFEARYRPQQVDNQGTVMWLEVGELIASHDQLAKRWNWTIKAVRTWLNRLEADSMLTRQTSKREPVRVLRSSELGIMAGSLERRMHGRSRQIITLSNYRKYQGYSENVLLQQGEHDGQLDGQLRGNSGATQGQESKKEKREEEESPLVESQSPPTESEQEEKFADPQIGPPPQDEKKPDQKTPRQKAKPKKKNHEYTEAFKAFWAYHPARDGKYVAYSKAWINMDPADYPAATEGAKRYAERVKSGEVETIKWAQGWLNDRRWEDEFDNHEAVEKFWWQKPEQVANCSDDRWRIGIAEKANGFWPLRELGPAPGAKGCVCPKHLIEELKLDQIYDERGTRR